MKTTMRIAVIAAASMLLCQCASDGDRVEENLDGIGRAIDENLPGLGPAPEWESDPYKDS